MITCPKTYSRHRKRPIKFPIFWTTFFPASPVSSAVFLNCLDLVETGFKPVFTVAPAWLMVAEGDGF